MTLPTDRTTSSTPSEHVADHNALHEAYNNPPAGGPPALGRLVASGSTYLSIPGVTIVSATTQTFGANLDQFYPWYVPTDITIDQMVIEVTASGAGTARLGIYNADVNWQPTSLVLDAGTVSVASTGVKTISVSQALPAGRYLAVSNTNVAHTLRAYRGGCNYLGIAPAMGASPFFTQLYHNAGRSYAAFPSTGDSIDGVTTGSTTDFLHCVLCRVSSP